MRDIGACLIPIVLKLIFPWFYELWSEFLPLKNWIAPSVYNAKANAMDRLVCIGNICQQAYHCSGERLLHHVLYSIWCGGLVCLNVTYFCSTTSKSDEWSPRGWYIFPVTPFRCAALSSMTPLFPITCRKLIWHKGSLISICLSLRWIARLVWKYIAFE